jgi:hypothetical protein
LHTASPSRCIVAALVVLSNVAPASAAEPARIAIGPGAIAVSVRDARNRPVQGALVVASGPTERDATTGGAGIATLMALPLGTYSVRVTRSAYVPDGRTVTLAAGSALPVLRVKLAAVTFAEVGGAATTTVRFEAGGADPISAHALAGLPSVAIVPAVGLAGAGLSLSGEPAAFTAYELDGIPLAGNGGGPAALRFRNALVLDSVEIAPGPAGVVDYRTAPFAQDGGASAALGYDSRFGSFQQAGLSRALGRLAIAAGLAMGGGENRSQVLKAQYDLSGATSLGFAAYGSQSSASAEAVNLSNDAPAFAADLRTHLGAGTFQARVYRSASASVAAAGPFSSLIEADRNAGTQVEYEVPAGENLLAITYERRFESDLLPGQSYRTGFATLGTRADLRLSRNVQLDLGDAYSSGVGPRPRHDPHAALTLRPTDRVKLTASAGSAFATGVPYLATAFGYRVEAEDALLRDERLAFDAFALRSSPAQGAVAAASRGVNVSFARDARPGGLGFTASAGLLHGVSFGGSGIPSASALAGVDYRGAAGLRLAISEALVGSGNAANAGSFWLSNGTARIPLGALGTLRFDAFNILGQPVRDPALEPFYGRSFGVSLSR